MPHADLVLGQAVAINGHANAVTVRTESDELDIRYTDLVVALGAVSRSLPIPGLAEYAVGFKTLPDAIHLRNHVLRELELADAQPDPSSAAASLSYVFVGAGYAGVEALAELRDLGRDALRYYPRLKGLEQRWLLVEAAPGILPDIPERLGEYATRHLLRTGTDIRTETTLEAIEGDAVRLSDGTQIEARTVVWTAGVRSDPVLVQLGLPLDGRGRVTVDGELRVKGVTGSGCSATVPRSPTAQHQVTSARRPASTRSDRPAGLRETSLRAGTAGRRTVQLPDARAGGDAWAPQGSCGRARCATHGVRRLVADAHVPPLSAPALLTEAQNRGRLDELAVLPARYRGAWHARTPDHAGGAEPGTRRDE